jgi:mannonate dehydratase
VPETVRYPMKAVPGYSSSRLGMQIGSRLPIPTSDDDLRFVGQIGVEWAVVSLGMLPEHNAAAYAALRERFAAFGLQIYRIANHPLQNMSEVTLNLPGRDAKIEQYLQYIRNLGAAGIRYATGGHAPNGIWTTGDEPIRGGATSRAFRLGRPAMGTMPDRTYHGELTHGRRYSEEELWDNYAYFIRKVVPVAEEAGVRIGIHPDDPPVYDVGGIPRCIFGSFDGYKRALEIADSPNIGMCLCVGCWLEGGERMGKSVVETIRYFGSRGKIFKVHLRNVTAPLPEGFVETYLDDGYGDMEAVMRALHEVQFDGLVISDHVPHMVGGRYASEALAVGYMKGLLREIERPLK